MMESKKILSESRTVGPITSGLTYIQTPAILNLAGGEVLQAV